MKTKHAFKKGDRVRVTKVELQRWRKGTRGGLLDPVRMYSGKVAEVTGIIHITVMVRFKGGQHAGFPPHMLELA